MKKSKILCFVIITSAIFFIPQISYARAEEKPSYVGVDVNDVLIWKVTIEPGEFEDALEDEGFSDAFVENYSDWLFDDEWDKDVEAWKFVIIDMKDEKEFDYKGDEYDTVPYYLNFYTTEDYAEKDWDREEMNERGSIAKYDKDLYTEIAMNRPFGMGLYYSIVANNINWEKLAKELDEELDDEYDGDDEKGSAKVVESGYKANGISTSINIDDDDFDDFDSISQYNDDGVCIYYEWSYDDDPIIILELEMKTLYEYWHVILAGTIIGIIAVVMVVIVIKKLRKRK